MACLVRFTSKWLRSLALALVLCILSWPTAVVAEAPAASQPQSPPADWPQYMGPTGDQAAAPSTVPLARSWTTDGPPVVWTVKGLGGAIGGAPSVLGGKVYFTERYKLPGFKNRGGNNAHNWTKYGKPSAAADCLRCADLYTGQEYWRYSHPAYGDNRYLGGMTTPAVDDRFVFFTGETGWLYCLDKNTGKEIWKCDLGERYAGWLSGCAGFTTSPLLYKDLVVMALGGGKASMAAFEKATGKVRWETPPVSYRDRYGPSAATPARFGGVEQFISLCGDLVYSVDAQSGKLLWQVQDKKAMHSDSQPLILEDKGQVIFVSTWNLSSGDGGLLRIVVERGPDGFVAKPVDLGTEKINADYPPIYDKGYLYFVSDQDNGDHSFEGLCCMELATGNITWREKFVVNWGPILRSPDGLLYVMTGSGKLRMFAPNPQRYEELGRRAKVVDSTYGSMALVNGLLINRGSRSVVCLDLSDPSYQRPQFVGRTPPATAPASRPAPTAVAFCKQLAAPGWEERNAAVEALAKLTGGDLEKVLPELTKALASKNWLAQDAAGQVLQKLGPTALQAAPELTAIAKTAVQGRDWPLAGLTLDALTAIAPASNKEVAPVIAAAMKDSDREVRQAALQLVEHMGPSTGAVVRAVLELHNGPDDGLARAAIYGLGLMPAEASQVAPVLVADLNQEEAEKDKPDRQFLAMAALRNLGPSAQTAAGELANISQEWLKKQRSRCGAEIVRLANDAVLSINPEPPPPSVQDVQITCREGEYVVVKLPSSNTASYLDTNTLTQIIEPAAHGTSVMEFRPWGLRNAAIYHARYGYTGKDSFAFQAWIDPSGKKDLEVFKNLPEKAKSRKGTVTIEILPRASEPLAVQAVLAQPGGKDLLVLFNKPADKAPAENPGNYALVVAGVETKVEKAVLNAEGMRAVLMTTGFTPNKDSFLTVSNLKAADGTGDTPKPVPVKFRTIYVAGGLTGDYYDKPEMTGDRWFMGSSERRMDPQINFPKGPQPGKQNYCVRWTGKLVAKRSAPHTFHVTAGGGFELWIADPQCSDARIVADSLYNGGPGPDLLNAWKNDKPSEHTAVMDLEAGHVYEFRLEFYARDAAAAAAPLTLEWSAPDLPRQVIPADCLFTASPFKQEK